MYKENKEPPSPLLDLYSQKDKMYLATDCIVFGFDAGQIKLLLFKRRVSPFEGEWSLIGSFVTINEDVSAAAKRVLEEITGLKDVYLKELKVYGDAKRDPGYRCVSVGQYALIRLSEYDKELVAQHGAVWHDIDKLPPLVLDHDKMVQDALQKLRETTRTNPLGFELLPQKFTIPQLQNVYEAILGYELDTRNFRKKILSHNLLIKLEEKDKSSSKRGAYLYQFDDESYKKAAEKGFNFEI